MKTKIKSLVMAAGLLLASPVLALEIPVYLTAEEGEGKRIGSVNVAETQFGLVFFPHLTDLSPGVHGMHIHESPLCTHMGNDAMGHWDPAHTGKHLGPYGKGHLGDLPALTVNAEGKANLPVLAPRLTLQDIEGHSLMIHQGEDNYSDKPLPNGGGGGRVACGIIPIEAQ